MAKIENSNLPEDFQEIKKLVVEKLLLMSNSNDEKFNDEIHNWFYSYIRNLKLLGWRRVHVYSLVSEILSIGHETLGDDAVDLLGEYVTGLIGFCAPQSIDRFPEDPQDLNELTSYVRGNKWR
ncbi:hypothetical protein GXP67_30735 [Rhodocytophaga rosea]|uniref:Uncharacterized protein n=1 Tax=Rhodocytophaga rosea TaxID=2704465 RepID=A0A6C0GRI7_9BACT|nr:hypothetical protein [Rhodocytophaga rosea]QHT70715.1 hypothetical protein GXP67_30735 [Rhodocytophaga rosea]